MAHCIVSWKYVCLVKIRIMSFLSRKTLLSFALLPLSVSPKDFKHYVQIHIHAQTCTNARHAHTNTHTRTHIRIHMHIRV